MFRLRVILTCLLALALPVRAKCPALAVFVHGDIVGAIPNEGKIKLQISSSEHSDWLNDVKQESTIKDSHFEAKGWFDTYDKMVHEEHVCSRKPDRVVVSLNIGQTVIDSRELTIEKNFKLTREGDYQVSESVKLTSKMP